VVAGVLILTLPAAACADDDGSGRQPTEPAATGPTGTHTTNGPSPIGLLYENADLHFTVEYPESWVADKRPQQTGVVVLFFATESAGDGFAENVNVVGPEELQLDFTSKQYGKAGWQNFRPLLRDVEVMEQRDLTIEGAPAFSMEYGAISRAKGFTGSRYSSWTVAEALFLHTLAEVWSLTLIDPRLKPSLDRFA
jgi:hypothetical protein